MKLHATGMKLLLGLRPGWVVASADRGWGSWEMQVGQAGNRVLSRELVNR
jgi:hypothetical protein